MEIKVIRKKEVLPESNNVCVTLLFKKTHLRTKYTKVPVVTMYDEKGEYLPVSVKLTQVQSKVPSVLLSKWINANCAEKLLTLIDKCNTIERVNLDKDESSKWFFTQKEDSIYGLHQVKTKCNGKKFRTIMIDSGIGMQSVVKIINNLNVDIEPIYDKVSNKMKQINLLFKQEK